MVFFGLQFRLLLKSLSSKSPLPVGAHVPSHALKSFSCFCPCQGGIRIQLLVSAWCSDRITQFWPGSLCLTCFYCQAPAAGVKSPAILGGPCSPQPQGHFDLLGGHLPSSCPASSSISIGGRDSESFSLEGEVGSWGIQLFHLLLSCVECPQSAGVSAEISVFSHRCHMHFGGWGNL